MDYGAIAELPVTIESHELTLNERETSSGFERVTTTVTLRGEDAVGRGEDVTYDTEDHRALAASTPLMFAGEYTIDSFSAAVGEMSLFPSGPQRPPSRRYRRWAVESAALDLALKQTGRSLAEVLDRSFDPVSYVVSTRLGEPPTTDRLDAIREAYPDAAFKLDPTVEWSPALIKSVAERDVVRILDLKGQYAHADVHQPANRSLYERLFAAFPDAIIEDPAVTEETRPLLTDQADRLAWDVPVTDVESLGTVPFEPNWINVKPSRIGTIADLCAVVSHCEEHGIGMYGGGQFELDVGRPQIQALASLCYPDAPNDVAPKGFNDPEVGSDLPTSPLDPPGDQPGFGRSE
ncbi:enolase-like domain-containing protein [Halorhabdus amylolytica]|uniref:hypothetical protein n=1 Tax=Halorhabdus amylolytica TaxID=2559573 RepID=UPI0010AA3938|nr:hypothetical protein [Halorhabdus amylolytica]